jgi:hypothetical protein
MNPITSAQGHIQELLTRHIDQFLGLGDHVFMGLATIVMVWFGVQTMLRAAVGSEPVPLATFASLVLTIALGYGMITYYDRPLPGIGYSFPELITEQAHSIAANLEAASVEAVLTRLDQLKEQLEKPPFAALLAYALYLPMLWAITVARTVLIFVIVFGDVATAVCVLLGPVFLPFFIAPGLEWLYWGWLKSLFQFAWYKVVAQAFVFVFGEMLLDFLAPFQAAVSFNELLYAAVHMIAILLVFSLGMLLVPVFTSSLISGRAGESILPTRVLG